MKTKIMILLLILGAVLVSGCVEETKEPVKPTPEPKAKEPTAPEPTTQPPNTTQKTTDTTKIDPYLFTIRDKARDDGVDLMLLINQDEMDRLYGEGFTDRFIETINRGSQILSSLEEYKNKTGRYPENLEELTPDFIESIPKTLIQHKEIRFSPYWINDDDTPEYFEEYQEFWYDVNDSLNSFALVFSGPNEYCNAATWSLSEKNRAQTYPFVCETQSILMRLGPPELTQKFETNGFEFYVPSDWKDTTEMFKSPGEPLDAYFLGLGEFPIRYNNNLLIVNLWLVEVNSPTLEQITEDTIERYSQNPDRVFPKDFQIEPKKIKLVSGEDANFIHVRFYRKTKLLNQSRFDLVTVNPRDNQGYAMTLSVQYYGEYWKAEEDLKLIEFAEQVFASFEFKN